VYDDSADICPLYSTAITRSAHIIFAPDPLLAPGVSWITIDSPRAKLEPSGTHRLVALPLHTLPVHVKIGQFSFTAVAAPGLLGSW
jgi:hypothetical protein